MDEITSKIHISTKNEVGRIIQKLFPSSVSKQERSKDDWSKKIRVFHGISFKGQTESVNFEDISQLCANSFLIEKTSDHITMGLFTGYVMNGNRVVAEIVFRNETKTWAVSVYGKEVNLTRLGISNTFKLDKSSIEQVIDTVKKFNYCLGVEKVHESREKSFLKLLCSKSGDENSGKYIFKSIKCLGVKSFRSRESTASCEECAKCDEDPKKEVLCDNSAKKIRIEADEQCEDKLTSTLSCDENLEQSVVLNESDHNDFSEILDRIFPNCTEPMKVFFTAQRDALKAKPKGRRWNKDVIRTCLTIWSRSPKSYVELKNSGFFILPSSRILQFYKNSVNQVSGFNKEILHWMMLEAKNQGISPDGYEGGIIIDEMTIQSDIQFSKKGGGISLIGFKDITKDESLYMDKLMKQKEEITLATHALQFIFLGKGETFTKFRKLVHGM